MEPNTLLLVSVPWPFSSKSGKENSYNKKVSIDSKKHMGLLMVLQIVHIFFCLL